MNGFLTPSQERTLELLLKKHRAYAYVTSSGYRIKLSNGTSRYFKTQLDCLRFMEKQG